MHHAGKEPFPIIYQDSREDDKKYEPSSKSQLKKMQKIWIREQYKNEEKGKKLLEDEEKRLKNLEEAKAVIIEEDKSLPEAKQIKIMQAVDYRDQRIKLYGWVHRLRRQGRYMISLNTFLLEIYFIQYFSHRQGSYVYHTERWYGFSTVCTE